MGHDRNRLHALSLSDRAHGRTQHEQDPSYKPDVSQCTPAYRAVKQSIDRHSRLLSISNHRSWCTHVGAGKSETRLYVQAVGPVLPGKLFVPILELECSEHRKIESDAHKHRVV